MWSKSGKILCRILQLKNTVMHILTLKTSQNIGMRGHLRNEFDFWKVHGIINTSGLLQSLREAQSNLLLIFTFYHK